MGKRLPRPKCKWGFTTGQIGKIMEDRFDEFLDWLNAGRTRTGTCTGWESDDEGNPRMNGCGPHGNVFFQKHVRAFLAGGPIVD